MAAHIHFEDNEPEEEDDPQHDEDNEYDDEDDEEGEDDDAEEELSQVPWLPPGADRAGLHKPVALFPSEFEEHFVVAKRLADKSADLIQAVNDFHYAMMNDTPRNEFYRDALKKVLTPESVVLEIGTGSGLLAMIAASLGAKKVYAVEANEHMANLAEKNIRVNGFQEKIEVINKLSTDVVPSELEETPTILLSEILGTLMLGESVLDYVHDAKKRLLGPDPVIIPPGGCQYATLVECHDLESITRVKSWGGLDLSGFNALQDTASVVFTKQYGFRFNTARHRYMAPSVAVVDVDFNVHKPGFLPLERRFPVVAQHTGIVHVIMLSWEVWGDTEKTLRMSTDPSDTQDNFPRDIQWGQALQLVEDEQAGNGVTPEPFHVTAGEKLELICRVSQDSVLIQFSLRRALEDSP